MALETLSSNELLNFIIYDTISANPYSCNNSSETNYLLHNGLKPQELGCGSNGCSSNTQGCGSVGLETTERRRSLAVQGRKKRKRRPRACKNKEEAETQRMTHITVERNRRKQMNEHLAVLRSLMPESYVPRGDQASTVGGAIEYVKELEHHLQSLEAQKFLLLQGGRTLNEAAAAVLAPPFSQFFVYPQYISSQNPSKYTSKSKAAMADIQVTMIETHANIRILSQRRVRQLSRMVAGFHTLYLSILHLNVTTLDPLVLYSISAKGMKGRKGLENLIQLSTLPTMHHPH
ncbi:unnamed protein product [Ilex paraguariensis]|uniref:BHLH domain-containing protein n=1 Tax=Ilex paraguariensis TaxID=185542 RepID=A0ABC8TWC8_9AQUA